ncbi:26366_t:CDS:1, partial [Racocetra persica]
MIDEKQKDDCKSTQQANQKIKIDRLLKEDSLLRKLITNPNRVL